MTESFGGDIFNGDESKENIIRNSPNISLQSFNTSRSCKQPKTKRYKRNSVSSSMRYSSLPVEIQRSSKSLKRTKKRKYATVHFPSQQNDDNNESFTIEWSSSDESEKSTSRAFGQVTPTRTCNTILEPRKSLSAKDDDDDSFTIEWSSSDESEKVLFPRYKKKKNNEILTTKKISAKEFDKNNTWDAKQSTQSTQSSLQLSMKCTQTQSIAEKNNLSERCRSGGYLDQFQQKMRNIKGSRKFLEFDKKYGLRNGINLRVLKVENSFGVHLATVVTPDNEVVQIVLYADNAKVLKTGSILESFIEQSSEPYVIERCGGVNKIYLQPHKFIQP